MKKFILIIICFSTVHAVFSQGIREMDLENAIVRNITVGFKKGVTTVMFPSGIKGIYGANVVGNPKLASEGSFLLSFIPGNYYFSLRALKEKATGSLNIVYNRKIYIFSLSTSDKDYDGSITMASSQSSSGVGGSRCGARTTPSTLVSLLDKAKAYPLFKKHHPEAVGADKLDYYLPKPAIRMEYKEFDIEINEVFRFKHHDTLIFSVYLVNKTDRVLTYDPRLFSVKVGEHILYPTLSDATGSIPPKCKTPAYFVICGSPEGGRNNLAAENNWSAYLTIEPFVDRWRDKREFIDDVLIKQQKKETYYESKKATDDRPGTDSHSIYSVGSKSGKSGIGEKAVDVKSVSEKD